MGPRDPWPVCSVCSGSASASGAPLTHGPPIDTFGYSSCLILEGGPRAREMGCPKVDYFHALLGCLTPWGNPQPVGLNIFTFRFRTCVLGSMPHGSCGAAFGCLMPGASCHAAAYSLQDSVCPILYFPAQYALLKMGAFLPSQFFKVHDSG